MGSCLSQLLTNLFVNVFETSVIDKLMNEGKVLHWTRYVDDVFAIVMKNSEDFIFGKLNNWDSNLEFTREVMTSEGLVFLDCLVFANGHKLHHKKYRKEGLNTVLSNFEKSVMCKKYLKNSLFTMLHRERDCCSNNELFHESLEELREILRRNNYPKRLVDNKIETFLKDDKKPDRPEKVHTLCIPYTSPSIEKYLHSLIKRMKMFVPYFEFNQAYKTLTLRDIISPYCKLSLDFEEVSNAVYQFQCVCSESYVGRTSRQLLTRIQEHQQESKAKGIYWHFLKCPKYQENLKKASPFDKQKENFNFFKSHFKILRKSFRSLFEQKRTEAFFIRTLRPGLNDQRDHNFFKLF